jgi:hypothetical protein
MDSDIGKEAHESKERKKNLIKAVKIIAIVTMLLVSGFLAYKKLFPSSQTSQTLKAAIIDQLGIKYPNETFVQTTNSILANAGFAVDYYDSSKVTVEFWRNLPADGYNLIVLRVHSITREPEVANYTGLFTVDPWDNMKYAYEKATDQILGAAFIPYHEGDPVYFAITSKFVTSSMVDRFNNTAIVMMGCSSLTYTDMAEALVEKGAKVCVGWDDMVSSTHTDDATAELLKYLITEKETIGKAITRTNEEVGPDPQYNSTLVYFPAQVENYVVPTTKDISTSNPFSQVSGCNREGSFHAPTYAYVGVLMECQRNTLIGIGNIFMLRLMVRNLMGLHMEENRKKKKVFFPFLMLVGAGLGFLLLERLGVEVFVAVVLVSSGLGLLLDSIVTIDKKEVRAELSVKVGGIIYCIVGAVFVVSGLLTLISPQLLVDYVTYLMGFAFIVVGAYLLVSGFRLVEATSDEK